MLEAIYMCSIGHDNQRQPCLVIEMFFNAMCRITQDGMYFIVCWSYHRHNIKDVVSTDTLPRRADDEKHSPQRNEAVASSGRDI